MFFLLFKRSLQNRMSVKAPLFYFSRKPTKPDEPKESPLWIFRHCATFFDFFLSPKSPPFVFLLFKRSLQNRMSVKAPLFYFSRKPTKPDGTEGSPLWIFSALCDFFRFFLSPKSPPFVFLLFKRSLQNRMSVKAPLFYFSRKPTEPDEPKESPLWIFFGTVRHFSKEKNSEISSFFPKKCFALYEPSI